MANAFSTKGATPNTGISTSAINKSTSSLSPKSKALQTIQGLTSGFKPQTSLAPVAPQPKASMVPLSTLNASSTSLTNPQTSPTKPKTATPQPGMVTHTVTYPHMPETQNNGPQSGMIDTSGNQNSGTTPPQISTTPVPSPMSYSGMVQNNYERAGQPSQQYTNLTNQAEEAYKKAANFGRDVGQAQLDVGTNPEYSIDTGVGLGNRIAQNTGLQMKALNDTAAGLGNLANTANTQQSNQNTALYNNASLKQPVQVPYSNQFIDPTTGQPVGGGTGGSLNSAVDNVVQKLQSGQMTYNDAVSALSGYGQGGINALQQALPSGFNIAQSNTLGGIQGTVGPAYSYADTALKNVETLMSQLPSYQNTNIPGVNNVTKGLSTLTGIGSEGTRAVTGALNTLRNAYASLLASSKGGLPTDYSNQALAEIPDNATPNDIAALRKNFETLGQARKDIYGNAGASNSSTGGDSTTAGGYGFKLVNGKWVPN